MDVEKMYLMISAKYCPIEKYAREKITLVEYILKKQNTTIQGCILLIGFGPMQMELSAFF